MKLFNTIIYPISYKTQNVLMHDKCKDELFSIFENNGLKTKFSAQFKNHLMFLAQNGANAPEMHREWFENLKGEKGICAMRFKSINNLRILYIHKGKKTYLLHSFQETSPPGKNNKNSYKHACEIAKERIKDIEEE